MATLKQIQLMPFLHPRYGLPDAAFGGPEATTRYGAFLPLALGVSLEMSIAVACMLLRSV